MDNGDIRNNHEELMLVLEGIDPVACRNVMSNFDIFINSIRKELLLQTVSAHSVKTEKDRGKWDLNAKKIWMG